MGVGRNKEREVCFAEREEVERVRVGVQGVGLGLGLDSWLDSWLDGEVEFGIGFVDEDGSEVGPFVVVAFVFVFVVDADVGVVVPLVLGLCAVDVGVSVEVCVVGVVVVAVIIPMLGIGKYCKCTPILATFILIIFCLGPPITGTAAFCADRFEFASLFIVISFSFSFNFLGFVYLCVAGNSGGIKLLDGLGNDEGVETWYLSTNTELLNVVPG